MSSTTTNFALVKPVGADAVSVLRTAIGANADIAEAALTTSTVTSLPGSPFDGQRVFYVADATNGVIWHLRYRAASASAYKWEYVGGAALNAELNGTESITSLTFGDMTTVGPSITVPLAGDYDIDFRANVRPQPTQTNTGLLVGVKIGAAAVGLNDQIMSGAATDADDGTPAGLIRRTVSAASTVVKLQYAASPTGKTGIFERRRLSVRPVRVG